MLTIAMAQCNFTVGAIEENLSIILETLQDSHTQADITVFPELAISSYPPEDLLFRKQLHERVNTALTLICDTVEDHTVIIGHPALEDGKIYNRLSVITQHQIIAQYDKQQLPNYDVFDEKRYFETGTNDCIITIKDYKIALLICEDTWNADTVDKALSHQVDLLISIHASPFDIAKRQRRFELISGYAKKYQTAIVYCNLVGGQDELVFDGSSFMLDKYGECINQAAFAQQDVCYCQWDPNNQTSSSKKTENKKPETQSYEDIPVMQQIYQILVLGLSDYVHKNKFPGAIIGLSGGIDSAVTLAIAVDALGADCVEAVLMPSQYTADISNEDAILQAQKLRVKHTTIPIEDCYHAFLKALEPSFTNHKADATEENIQARCRGVLLMALSNKTAKIVVTTGNKSELSVGYCTLYGDMAGGFAVLKDVPKTWVYQLAEYYNNKNAQKIIPQRVIDRAPSAELAPDQSDQDNLPSYDILDEIIDMYVEQDKGYQSICRAGFDPETVKKVILLINRNEYKRRQAAVGIRINKRAYGKDRRYPITSGFTDNLSATTEGESIKTDD